MMQFVLICALAAHLVAANPPVSSRREPPAPVPLPPPLHPPAAQLSTTPTLCTSANQGSCECANLQPAHSPVAKGKTYTWTVNGKQRCLTTLVGSDDASDTHIAAALPTVLYLQCYGKDRLRAFTRDAIDAADRFGLAMAYLSTPDGAWSWNNTIVNDASPRPCNASVAGQDYTYVADSLAFLATQSFFDATRVYTYGFSQNGMGSAYIGQCFDDQITGSWMGGAGLFTPGKGPVPPNNAGTCEDGCKYWPAFPCHASRTALAVQQCIQFYSNDPVTVDQHPYDSEGHGFYLFDRLVSEGNDGRMLEFQPDSTQSIMGGHSGPQNVWDWLTSCFGGMSTPCTSACETALLACVKGAAAVGGASTAATTAGYEAYATCMTSTLVESKQCAKGCTPTFKMVATSEVPTLNLTKGTGWSKSATQHARPQTSVCEV